MHTHQVAAQRYGWMNGRPGTLLERSRRTRMVIGSSGAADSLTSFGKIERLTTASGSTHASRSPTAHPRPRSWPLARRTRTPKRAGRSCTSCSRSSTRTCASSRTGRRWACALPARTRLSSTATSCAMRRSCCGALAASSTLRSGSPSASPCRLSWRSTQASPRRLPTSFGPRARGRRTSFSTSQWEKVLNAATTARLAHDSMVTSVNNFDFKPGIEHLSQIFVRKTIVARACLEACGKAMETFGGRAYYRSVGVERLIRDAYAGLFHVLPEKKQHVFCGRLELGLDPVGVSRWEAPTGPSDAAATRPSGYFSPPWQESCRRRTGRSWYPGRRPPRPRTRSGTRRRCATGRPAWPCP